MTKTIVKKKSIYTINWYCSSLMEMEINLLNFILKKVDNI